MQIVLALALSLLATSAHAQTPSTMRHQSRVLDTDGNPINSTVAVRAELHGHVTSDDERWGEDHASVIVADGYLSVALGSVVPFPAGVFDGGPLWLELTVGGTTVGPRTELSAVPYAFTAARVADQADAFGGLCSRISIGTTQNYNTLSSELNADPTAPSSCGANSHVCNAAEFETYTILGNCDTGAGTVWLVGGFSNAEFHRRSIWSGQDSTQCASGRAPAGYNEWLGYKGRIHCEEYGNNYPALCCRNTP